MSNIVKLDFDRSRNCDLSPFPRKIVFQPGRSHAPTKLFPLRQIFECDGPFGDLLCQLAKRGIITLGALEGMTARSIFWDCAVSFKYQRLFLERLKQFGLKLQAEEPFVPSKKSPGQPPSRPSHMPR